MPINYQSPSSPLYAGMFAPSSDINTLLDSIAALGENSWLKLNINNFEDVWPVDDLRPTYNNGKANPKNIIQAWSSFAWDKNKSRLILWGGGHANTSSNEPYVFNATTGLWELAFVPSAYRVGDPGVEVIPVCGGYRVPQSSHTYDNQIYLPILDKFLTMGGAAFNSGGPFALYDESNNLVSYPSAYKLDLTLSGQGLVGGATGDNQHDGAYAGVDIQGANAWEPIQWLTTPAGDAFNGRNGSINGLTAYDEENGKDVVYMTKSSGTARSLFKVVFNDDDYANDTITQVGRYYTGSSGDGAGAYDDTNKVFLFTQTNTTTPFMFWDVSLAGTTNNEVRVNSANIAGTDIVDYIAESDFGDFGMDFSPLLGKYFLWSRGGTIYTVTPPVGLPTPDTGWVVEKLPAPVGNVPMTSAELAVGTNGDTGVMGKWEHAPELNCFIGLQHMYHGDVWLYKPTGWIDPRN